MADLDVAAPREQGWDDPRRNGHRRIRPRKGLPGGRAVLGGFLVAASAVGIFAAYSAAGVGPEHSYVVAAADLDIGHVLVGADLTTLPIDLPDAVRRRAFADPAALVGATVLAARGAGDLLQAGDVILVPGEPGSRELSFSVDTGRALGDRIRAGERVDVVATYGTGRDAFTMAVVMGARVLRMAPAAGGVVGEGRVQLTLELHGADQALALAHAVDAGQVTVVRSTGGAPESAPDPYRPAGQGAGATPAGENG